MKRFRWMAMILVGVMLSVHWRHAADRYYGGHAFICGVIDELCDTVCETDAGVLKRKL